MSWTVCWRYLVLGHLPHPWSILCQSQDAHQLQHIACDVCQHDTHGASLMSYIYSHCRTEGRWLTGVNLQVRTSTKLEYFRTLIQETNFNNFCRVVDPPAFTLCSNMNAGQESESLIMKKVTSKKFNFSQCHPLPE